MKQVRTADTGYCSQHHQPRTECDPASRHVQPFRASDTLMRKVEAKAANLGMDRNAGMEAALEAWTDDVDEEAPSPLEEVLAGVRALRVEMAALQDPAVRDAVREERQATLAACARDRSALAGAVLPDATLKFRSTDPEDAPDVIPYPVPEPARKGRAKSGCGHHVPAGTRCKICQPAKS